MPYQSPHATADDLEALKRVLPAFPADIRPAIVRRFHEEIDHTYNELYQPMFNHYLAALPLREGYKRHLRLVQETAYECAVLWGRHLAHIFLDDWAARAGRISFAFRLDERAIGELARTIASHTTQRRIDVFLRLTETLDPSAANVIADKIITQRGIRACKRLKVTPASGGFSAASQRYCDTSFWIRKLRRALYPIRESYARELGMISSDASPYASPKGIDIRKSQLASAEEWARGTVAINPETGEPVSMKAILNTAHDAYRAKVIAKATGIRNFARRCGYPAAMITITCPGSFRPGRENYRDIQGCLDHLRTVEKRINSAARDAGVHVMGLSVTQPHKDGTPHRHTYVVGTGADILCFYDIVRQKALDDFYPDEPGAQEARVDIKWEDAEKGSLSSYALSYVLRFAKPDAAEAIDTDNINSGGSKDEEHQTPACTKDGSGEDSFYALNHARRIGWIGDADDFAWEASRRLTHDMTKGDAELEAIRVAAAAGDYAEWLWLVGGPCVPRKLRPYQSITEARENRYGEQASRYIGATILGLDVIVKGLPWELAAGINVNCPREDSTSDDMSDSGEIVCLWSIVAQPG